MLTTPPKELRENIARANGYLRREEVQRALHAMATAMRQYASVKLMRSARAEVEIQMDDFLHTLVRHQSLQHLLDPQNTGRPRQIKFEHAKAQAIAAVLDGLARILQQEAENAQKSAQEAKAERKRTLIQTGIQLLQQGQFGKGRAFLKRAAEEFGSEKGLHIQIAKILFAAKQYAEAGEMYEESMARYPRESAAYVGAINAYAEINEFEKMERVYKSVLRTFGGHPNTYGRMAMMYWKWHKRQQAEELAIRALQGNPNQPEALEIMDHINNRGGEAAATY